MQGRVSHGLDWGHPVSAGEQSKGHGMEGNVSSTLHKDMHKLFKAGAIVCS